MNNKLIHVSARDSCTALLTLFERCEKGLRVSFDAKNEQLIDEYYIMTVVIRWFYCAILPLFEWI